MLEINTETIWELIVVEARAQFYIWGTERSPHLRFPPTPSKELENNTGLTRS